MKTAVSFNYTVPVDNSKGVATGIRNLTAYDVLVGVPAEKDRDRTDPSNSGRGKTNRKPVKGKRQVNNAMIAWVMNNGSPSQNIPARPTLEPGIIDAQQQIASYMEGAGRAGIEGGTLKVEQNLNAAGIAAQNAVRNRIASNTPPPLSPKTLAARRARGRTGTRTLFDTGQFLAANTYIVRKK